MSNDEIAHKLGVRAVRSSVFENLKGNWVGGRKSKDIFTIKLDLKALHKKALSFADYIGES